ncbi:translation initiation factor eIF4e [Aulographum hederae CBS 113979]|uniref:Translation initiation factor eIF4e n=1 Tax=Aulographum hederae CBS 113979 TaxID=1176131 RepID=A0A6G1HA60_9PEZI|nr:translation initiation factor eIF4e [Aulographum hederae CBS 113979]
MATRPGLMTSNLPQISEQDLKDTTSPARGKEMRTNLLSKLRPPPFVHTWDFYHDRQNRSDDPKNSGGNDDGNEDGSPDKPYAPRLAHMTSINDIRDFWSLYNNAPFIDKLPVSDSVHLFHKGVKPVWEDPRNNRGGSWAFRVEKKWVLKRGAPEGSTDPAYRELLSTVFFREVCLLAVGEHLQEAVKSKRITFLDDITGVSLSIRRAGHNLIQIWNRDCENTAGIQKILETVLAGIAPDLVPKSHLYYYKAHRDHVGFVPVISGGVEEGK